MSFNGKVVVVEDKNDNKAFVTIGSEEYQVKSAPIMAGNLFMGEPYVESLGITKITCEQSGMTADVNFKPRKGNEMNLVEASVKD